MKLDLGLAAIEVPNSMMPTLVVGIGPEDVAESAKGDLYGTSEVRKQRRAWSISFGPADPSKKPDEVLQGDVNRIQLGCRGKVAKLEDKAVGDLRGKYYELEYVGQTQLNQVTFAFSVIAGGALHTYTYTALAGKGVAEARKEFLAIIDSLRPGSMFTGK